VVVSDEMLSKKASKGTSIPEKTKGSIPKNASQIHKEGKRYTPVIKGRV